MTRLSNLISRELGANDDKVVTGSSKADNRNLSKSKKSKKTKSKIQICINIGAMGESIFLTPGTKEAFNQLSQAFAKALILQHFDPECYIWIETDVSGYAIGRILS